MATHMSTALWPMVQQNSLVRDRSSSPSGAGKSSQLWHRVLHTDEIFRGYAWTRPGLEKRDRSLLNLGMLMALNRAPELAVHVRGARNNGLSELEIREAIIHATTYCGVPAGVDAFKIAERVFNDMAEKGEKPRELAAKSSKA